MTPSTSLNAPSASGLSAAEHLAAAHAAQQAGNDAATLRSLNAALALAPLHPEANIAKAALLAKHGKLPAAIALLQAAVLQQPDNVETLWQYARYLTQARHITLALAAMHRYAQLCPEDAAPKRYLAALYGVIGHSACSQQWAKKAVLCQPFTVRHARVTPRLTVLALYTQLSGALRVNTKTFEVHAAEGHNNVVSLLDRDYITVVTLYVDALVEHPEVLSQLPAVQVIYNAITDPERCEQALQLAQRVCEQLALPVVNAPNAVLAASREGNFTRWQHQQGITVPRSIKVAHTQRNAQQIVQHAMAEHGLTLPVIIRLAGFQGGKYMHKVEHLEQHDFTELDVQLAKQPQTAYVIQYHEVSYTDARLKEGRLYPKYRALWVGGELYPAHRFVDVDNFNVHLKNYTALLERAPWLREAMDDYVDNPEQHFAPGQWAALKQFMGSLGMEYVGVDFAPSTDPAQQGQLVIFEANASMRNRLDDLPLGDDRHDAFKAITEAAHRCLCRQAGVMPWPFRLVEPPVRQLTLSAGGLCLPKNVLPDHSLANQRWLAQRLTASPDFSDTPFFNHDRYIDEVLIEHVAMQQGMHLQRLPSRMLQLTKGTKQVVFHINAARVPMDAHLFERDKPLVKRLLSEAGFPTPPGEAFTEFATAYRYFARCTRPQVVKPVNGFSSRGVSIHITTPEAFVAAWQVAKKVSHRVLVEDMIQGEELRLWCLNGQCIQAHTRTPAFVIGDGQQTIEQLIAHKNQQRQKNPATARGLIKDTPALARAGRSVDEVPALGEWVTLGDKHIFGEGAEYIVMPPNQLPRRVVALCEQAVQQLTTSQVCGVDVFVEDLENGEGLWITELNTSTPGLSAYHFPRFGKPFDMVGRVLKHAFQRQALPVTPSRGAIAPAKPCADTKLSGHWFEVEQLQRLACLRNVPIKRPADDALQMGQPPMLGWMQGVSTATPMESVQVLKHKEWLGSRLAAAGVAKAALKEASEVRLLVVNGRVVAAHRQQGSAWQDITGTLHRGVADIAARVMHAIYRPGHALVTLTLVDPTSAPEQKGWGLKSITLQPDLSMFYTGIDQPRDVMAALYDAFTSRLPSQRSPAVCKLVRLNVSTQEPALEQWLLHELAQHALEGHINALPSDEVAVTVTGQPNAITAFVARCHRAAIGVYRVDVSDGEASVKEVR